MPATPQTPSNPDQKDQKDKNPWRKRLQGWWLFVKTPFTRVSDKMWPWDRRLIKSKRIIFNHLDDFFPWFEQFPYKRPALTLLFIVLLAVIFFFRGLFIVIFPLSTIATAPFFLSFWYIALALGLLAISALLFPIFAKVVDGFIKVISNARFLLLLLLGFVIALYHPPFADSLLSIVIDKYSGKINPFVPAIATMLGFLLIAQRLDMMNKQAEIVQSQYETERFKQASELLDNKKPRKRIDGIVILRTLAQTKPKEWHITVVNELAYFIQERSIEGGWSPVKRLSDILNEMEHRKDEMNEEEIWERLHALKTKKAPAYIEKAMRVIACDLTEAQKDVVQKHLKAGEYWPDLSKSWLCNINLDGAYLPKALLSDSFFTETNLNSSNLADARLEYTHFDRTSLIGANLQGIRFGFTNVAGADFNEATGFEGDKLSSCYYIDNEELPNHWPGNIEHLDSISIQKYWEYTRNWYKAKKEGG